MQVTYEDNAIINLTDDRCLSIMVQSKVLVLIIVSVMLEVKDCNEMILLWAILVL